jgi:nucleotide-binding universal stress UspA family protein
MAETEGNAMNQSSTGHVATATDGTDAGTKGVRYAAAEAARRHVRLEILHVMPAYLPSGPLPIVPDGLFQDSARSVVQHAEKIARKAAPDVEVSTSILLGGRVSSIVDEAADADVLVLGGREASTAQRVWTGATVTGVAARAACPVVVVPPPCDIDSAPRGRVVAAVKSVEHAGPVLRAAFAEAAASGGHVLVVHAWRLAAGYDDLVAERSLREEWADQIGKQLDEQLVEVRRAYPQVECNVDVVHGQPAHLLLGLSTGSDRLVISRPAHGGRLHHLGATARAVLRGAACPVEVVPPVEPSNG